MVSRFLAQLNWFVTKEHENIDYRSTRKPGVAFTERHPLSFERSDDEWIRNCKYREL
jgi:hypothetical protein